MGATSPGGTAELNLPPLRFSRLGMPGFYASWIRPALFASALVTNLDESARQRKATSVGTQFDLKLTAMSSIDLTVSVGAGVVFERGRDARREIMASLTLLH